MYHPRKKVPEQSTIKQISSKFRLRSLNMSNLSTKFYKIKRPKYTLEAAKRRDATYSVPIYIVAHLKKRIETSKAEVFLGDVPLMTNEGTFLVNGIERVIINQIVRSPGIYFKSEIDRQGSRNYIASLISNRGTWIKFEVGSENFVQVKIDKARDLSAYSFLRALLIGSIFKV